MSNPPSTPGASPSSPAPRAVLVAPPQRSLPSSLVARYLIAVYADPHCRLGLRVAIADLDKQALEAVGAELSNIHAHLQPNVLRSLTCSTTTTAAGSSAVSVLMVPADVVRIEDVMRLRDKVYETWGEVSTTPLSAPDLTPPRR